MTATYAVMFIEDLTDPTSAHHRVGTITLRLAVNNLGIARLTADPFRVALIEAGVKGALEDVEDALKVNNNPHTNIYVRRQS